MTIYEASRLSELEEILGVLYSLEMSELGLIAVIGKIKVLLPEELAPQLESLLGKRMALLRLRGYHVRCLEDKHA